jgi:rfaE bifunctional protein kinase chain/domain
VTTRDRLLNIVKSFSEREILIIGDAIADRFLHGSISRVSREAPVFILRHEQTETIPGGAANCAVNLASLGAEVCLISVVGNDEAGAELISKLKNAGVDTTGILTSEKYQTTTKVRVLAGQSHSNKQQVIRIDYEDAPLSNEEIRLSLLAQLRQRAETADAIIISDYNYGVVDNAVVDLLKEISKERSVPVLLDSRYRLAHYNGLTAATPNEDEVEHLVGEPITSDDQLERAAIAFHRTQNYQALLVTRGGKGMMLIEDGASPIHIEAVGAHQPVDVTGAGDTVIATFALSLAGRASFADAARLANFAGGLVVMKRGTASINADELTQSILSNES